MEISNRYTCPVCGYKSFSEPPGSYQICSVCGWEDDVSQLRFVTATGANETNLIDAQSKFNLSSPEKVQLKAGVFERDPHWRMFDARIDRVEISEQGKDYGETYPSDRTKLYYWVLRK